MQNNINELITNRQWNLLSKQFGIKSIDIPIHPQEYPAWNIPKELQGRIRLVAKGSQIRILSAENLRSKEVHSLIRSLATKSDEIILWILPGAPSEFALFNKELQKVQRVEAPQIDSLFIDLEHDLEESLNRMFDLESITKQFFYSFRKNHALLSNAIKYGPDDIESRDRIALIWLLRIIFLYFAQVRGALNGDLAYLSNSLTKFTNTKAENSYQKQFLECLFFGILNTPSKERTKEASRLGTIPFLNGGLFEPSVDEKNHNDMYAPNPIWEHIFESLFDRFRFTIEEEESRTCAAIDPEMLGKVFEALMNSGDRKRTGAYYTPQPVITSMVSDGIYRTLEDATGFSKSDIESKHFDEKGRRKITKALNKIRILDPAVGTGGFLIQSLHVIQQLRRNLDLPSNAKTLVEIIHRHLYGVDKNPTAVRLCELRFWLQILSAYRGPISALPPLPNLSHRFVVGDTLLDPFDTISSSQLRKEWKRVAGLQTRFSKAHGKEKRNLRRDLDSRIHDLQHNEIQRRRKKLEKEKRNLLHVLEGKNLFGEPLHASLSQSEYLRKNAQSLVELAALEKQNLRFESAPIFSYSSHFPEVMSRGGFDLLLMNPPWVRQHHIPRAEREVLKYRYRSNRSSLWDSAAQQSISRKYGSQCDLSSMFLERSLELVRPGGRVVALVPSKTLRGMSSAPIRGIIAAQDIEKVIDLSENKKQLFDATTYPSVLQFRKQNPTSELLSGDSLHSLQSRSKNKLLLFGDDTRAPWTCVSPIIGDLIRRICEEHRPLGSYTCLQPRRGIFTGANDVFIKTKGTFPKEFRKFVRPLIEGKEKGREILFLYDSTGRPLRNVPEELNHYFENHRKTLEARSDQKNTLPLWQVFRMHPDLIAPKIIWKDISKLFKVSMDTTAALPLNTVYCIPCSDLELAHRLISYFESDFVRAFVRLLAERVRGGYRRHFAWTIKCIPIPEEIFHPRPKKTEYLSLSSEEKRTLAAFLKNEK